MMPNTPTPSVDTEIASLERSAVRLTKYETIQENIRSSLTLLLDRHAAAPEIQQILKSYPKIRGSLKEPVHAANMIREIHNLYNLASQQNRSRPSQKLNLLITELKQIFMNHGDYSSEAIFNKWSDDINSQNMEVLSTLQKAKTMVSRRDQMIADLQETANKLTAKAAAMELTIQKSELEAKTNEAEINAIVKLLQGLHPDTFQSSTTTPQSASATLITLMQNAEKRRQEDQKALDAMRKEAIEAQTTAARLTTEKTAMQASLQSTLLIYEEKIKENTALKTQLSTLNETLNITRADLERSRVELNRSRLDLSMSVQQIAHSRDSSFSLATDARSRAGSSAAMPPPASKARTPETDRKKLQANISPQLFTVVNKLLALRDEFKAPVEESKSEMSNFKSIFETIIYDALTPSSQTLAQIFEQHHSGHLILKESLQKILDDTRSIENAPPKGSDHTRLTNLGQLYAKDSGGLFMQNTERREYFRRLAKIAEANGGMLPSSTAHSRMPSLSVAVAAASAGFMPSPAGTPRAASTPLNASVSLDRRPSTDASASTRPIV